MTISYLGDVLNDLENSPGVQSVVTFSFEVHCLAWISFYSVLLKVEPLGVLVDVTRLPGFVKKRGYITLEGETSKVAKVLRALENF